MDVKSPTLDTMLKTHMKYMSERQGVLAHNVANIDTPGYKAQDLKKLDFGKMAEAHAGKLQMAVTAPQHLNGTLGSGGAGAFSTVKDRETFEISPDKNNVVLEDQMARISDTNAQFQLSSTMLKKFTNLYRIAAGKQQ